MLNLNCAIQRRIACVLVMVWLVAIPVQSLHACALMVESVMHSPMTADDHSQFENGIQQVQLSGAIASHETSHEESSPTMPCHSTNNRLIDVVSHETDVSDSLTIAPSTHAISDKDTADCPDHCYQGGHCSGAIGALLISGVSPEVAIVRSYIAAPPFALHSILNETSSPPPKA